MHFRQLDTEGAPKRVVRTIDVFDQCDAAVLGFSREHPDGFAGFALIFTRVPGEKSIVGIGSLSYTAIK